MPKGKHSKNYILQLTLPASNNSVFGNLRSLHHGHNSNEAPQHFQPENRSIYEDMDSKKYLILKITNMTHSTEQKDLKPDKCTIS